jgi:hypothetical protein
VYATIAHALKGGNVFSIASHEKGGGAAAPLPRFSLLRIVPLIK